MNNIWQGSVAVVLFLFLLLLFLAAVATPEVTAGPRPYGNTGTAVFATPATSSNLGAAQAVGSPKRVNTPQPLVMPPKQPGAAVYLVQPGDWLSAIASRYNTTVPAILAVNPQITDPDLIYPGQMIVIP